MWSILRNPKGDGKAGYYVGMTGLTPEQRFANHKAGIKSASVVRSFGERLVPVLYEHLNPMPYADAVQDGRWSWPSRCGSGGSWCSGGIERIGTARTCEFREPENCEGTSELTGLDALRTA